MRAESFRNHPDLTGDINLLKKIIGQKINKRWDSMIEKNKVECVKTMLNDVPNIHDQLTEKESFKEWCDKGTEEFKKEIGAPGVAKGFIADIVYPPSQGLKYDTDKPRMELLELTQELLKDADILAPELYKMSKENTLPDGALLQHKYSGRLIKYIAALMNGERMDYESKLSLLKLISCNALFLLWFEIQEAKNESDKI